MTWLRKLYDRRIVNVNVNVVAAGLLALIPTTIFSHLTRRFNIEHRLVLTIMTLVADLLFDVSIYYVLHWLANHMPRRHPRKADPAYSDLGFVRDASLVQFQRAVISPILYLVVGGLMLGLMHLGVQREHATVIGFISGIAVSRVIHTIWMYRAEKKARTQAATAPVDVPATAPEARTPHASEQQSVPRT